MFIKKDKRVTVRHQRKGKFQAIALRDFDTEHETFYPLALAQREIEGANRKWVAGDLIACRDSLCTLFVYED